MFRLSYQWLVIGYFRKCGLMAPNVKTNKKLFVNSFSDACLVITKQFMVVRSLQLHSFSIDNKTINHIICTNPDHYYITTLIVFA